MAVESALMVLSVFPRDRMLSRRHYPLETGSRSYCGLVIDFVSSLRMVMLAVIVHPESHTQVEVRESLWPGFLLVIDC